MSFINPSILPWLGLISIPIIIYLINRRRFKRLIWAAMEFLLRAMKKNRRRLRIENLLLLIVRTLIILLLVLAVARPQVKEESIFPTVGRKKKNVVLVVDNSYSMAYKIGPTSVLEKAKSDLKIRVDKYLNTADRVVLMAMNDLPQLIYKTPVTIGGEDDKRSLRANIDGIELTHKTTDAYATLRKIVEILDKFETDPGNPTEEKVILMATDCQAAAWLRGRGLSSREYVEVFNALKKKKARLWLIDVGADKPTNFAITDIRVEGDGLNIGTRMPVTFFVDLKNFSSENMSITLTFSVDDIPQITRSISLGAYQRLTESFIHEFQTTGSHYVRVNARSDPLAVDNERSLAINVRDSIKVLLVDGKPSPDPYESEISWLKAVFDAQHAAGTTLGMPFYDYEVRTVSEFTEIAAGVLREQLEDYDVLILANVGNLPSETAAAVKKYVSEGGGLLYFLGDMIEPERFNSIFYEDGKGLLPYRLVEVFPKDESSTNYYGVEPVAVKHPVVDEFDGFPEALENPKVYRFFRVEESTRKGSSVIARITGEQNPWPVIVEQRYGKGSSLFILTTASTNWNNWGCFQFFLVLVYESVAYLSTMGSARMNIWVGEEFNKTIPLEAWAADVLITRPDGRTVAEKLAQKEGKEKFFLKYSDTDISGVYRLSFNKGERIEYFVCNPDTTESNLTRIVEEDFKRALPTADVKIVSYQKSQKKATKKEEEPMTELWHLLIALVLILLAFEMLIAMLFGRRRGEAV